MLQLLNDIFRFFFVVEVQKQAVKTEMLKHIDLLFCRRILKILIEFFLFHVPFNRILINLEDLDTAEWRVGTRKFYLCFQVLLVNTVFGLDLSYHFVVKVYCPHLYFLLPSEAWILLQLLSLEVVVQTGLNVVFVVSWWEYLEKHVSVL